MTKTNRNVAAKSNITIEAFGRHKGDQQASCSVATRFAQRREEDQKPEIAEVSSVSKAGAPESASPLPPRGHGCKTRRAWLRPSVSEMPQKELPFFGHGFLGLAQSWRRRLSQLDPTWPSSPSGRSSPALQSFAPDHPPLVPKWFMFCGSCFVHWVSPFQARPLPLRLITVSRKALSKLNKESRPWKSLTTVSPRLCCVLAALLASSLPPVVLLLLLRPPILRSPALA